MFFISVLPGSPGDFSEFSEVYTPEQIEELDLYKVKDKAEDFMLTFQRRELLVLVRTKSKPIVLLKA